MPAERWRFDAPLQPLVYWDTSFVIASIFESEPYHAECLALRQRMKRNRVLPAISDFVFDELAFWMVKNRLVTEARTLGWHWRELGRRRPDIMKAVLVDAAFKRVALETEALKLPMPDSITDRAFQLMHNFVLLPTDAYHIAAALESGVNAFVTLDQDFLAVDGINVYTCLP